MKNFFKNYFSFFKRVKEPSDDIEVANGLKKEAKLYLLTTFLFTVVIVLLSDFIPSDIIKGLIGFVGFVLLMLCFYFGIVIYGIKKVKKRIGNLTCDKCGEKLGSFENTEYEVLSKNWHDFVGNNVAKSNLDVRINFICKCPKCGTIKSFTETLCAATINSSQHADNATIIPDEQLVKDYLTGIIHK